MAGVKGLERCAGKEAEPQIWNLKGAISRLRLAQAFPIVFVVSWRNDVSQNLDRAPHGAKPLRSAWLRRGGHDIQNRFSEARYAKRPLCLLHLIEQGEAIGLEVGDSDFFHQSY